MRLTRRFLNTQRAKGAAIESANRAGVAFRAMLGEPPPPRRRLSEYLAVAGAATAAGAATGFVLGTIVAHRRAEADSVVDEVKAGMRQAAETAAAQRERERSTMDSPAMASWGRESGGVRQSSPSGTNPARRDPS